MADAMLPHLRDRLLHMHRYPEGVEGPRFWQKACPEHRPDWLPVAPVWSRDKQANIELHTSLHLRHDLHRPTAMAFDLDPGEGVGVLECGEVALRLRELFEEMGKEACVKTSGSKGLQVYVPMPEPVTYSDTKPAGKAIAELLERERAGAVVSRMAKSLRAGKVLVDWSQNTEHKSMVCVYSVRAKERPTVSTPIAWAELEDALDAADPALLVFEMGDVLERVAEQGDLFEPLAHAGTLPDDAR